MFSAQNEIIFYTCYTLQYSTCVLLYSISICSFILTFTVLYLYSIPQLLSNLFYPYVSSLYLLLTTPILCCRVWLDPFVKHALLGNGRIVLGGTPEALGILPTAEARQLDSFLPATCVYLLGRAGRGATCISLSVSCWPDTRQASYSLELRTADSKLLRTSGTAVRRTEKLLSSDDDSLQLEITEEFRRLRVSFVGQLTSLAEERDNKKKVVFVRLQAWFQVLYSPVRDSCIDYEQY